MIRNEKGFTLIEIMVTLSLISIISLIAISVPVNAYNETLLKSAALELKGALQLAQELSLDESRSYRVDLLENKFRLRQDVIGGRIVLVKQFDKNISIDKNSDRTISYNRNGETSYGIFILVNKKGRKITIDTLIGTGRVRISDIY